MSILLLILSGMLNPTKDQEIITGFIRLFAIILGLTYDVLFICKLI